MTQTLRINNFCCSCDLERCRKQRQPSLRLLGEAEEVDGRLEAKFSSLEQCRWRSNPILGADVKSSSVNGFNDAYNAL